MSYAEKFRVDANDMNHLGKLRSEIDHDIVCQLSHARNPTEITNNRILRFLVPQVI